MGTRLGSHPYRRRPSDPPPPPRGPERLELLSVLFGIPCVVMAGVISGGDHDSFALWGALAGIFLLFTRQRI